MIDRGGTRPAVIWDHLIFSLQRAGGIGAWWTSHCDALGGRVDARELGPYVNDNVHYAQAVTAGGWFAGRPAPRNRLPPWWPLVKAPSVPGGGLYHASYFRLPPARCRSVVTFHDFDAGTPGVRARLRHAQIARCVRRADAIHCISHHAAAQLRAWLGDVPEARIRVIHHGMTALPRPADCAPAGIEPESYVLWVGNRRGYKNGRLALAAARAIAPLTLVLAGGEPLDDEERALARAAGDRVIALGRLGGRELSWLYQHAVALWYLSRNEGFGFPALEAASHGCPVLAHAGHAVEEVAGTYAHLDPAPTVEWLVETTRAVQTSAVRERLRATGPRVAASFTWDAYADAMLALYRSVV